MKHQLKLQTPNSKLQGSSKKQALDNGKTADKIQSPGLGGKPLSQYPQPCSGAWVLNDEPERNGKTLHGFDLVERTACFGEAVIRFCKKVPHGPGNNRLIDQLVGAATSIGANYCEASERQSRKDFKCSISRCVKEAKETKHFLRMIAASEPSLIEEARTLFREANEVHLIFASIYRK
jgi:four helix bundle protein